MENKIEFRTQTNQIQDSWVMRITSDRRIEVNEDVEVTDAAKKVLEAMQHMLTPQRTWVGLTDGEMREITYETGFGLLMNVWFDGHDGNPKKVLQAIEAKLKEKNT